MRAPPEVGGQGSWTECYSPSRGEIRGWVFSSAGWYSDSRGPLAWPSSISATVPSCGAYQLHQQASTVSPRARKCLWLWRRFVLPNSRLCNMGKIMYFSCLCRLLGSPGSLCSKALPHVNLHKLCSNPMLTQCTTAPPGSCLCVWRLRK